MGFLDKAKAAANDLAAKADTALANSGMGGPGGSAGDSDKYFRDLGVLAYLEANGRPASPEDRERVMAALTEMESRGAIRSFTLQTSAAQSGAVPPPPGAAAGAATPDAATTPPPAPAAPPPPAAAPPQPDQSTSTAPPPPPPSWANG